MGQTSVEPLDVLQTSFPPSPSWIQDGEVGNDVIQDLGRVFRSLLRCAVQNGGPSASGRHLGWPHLREPEMRSSKMATGSGRAPFCTAHRNGDRKTRPILLIGPIILPGKLLLQDAARLKLAWDDKMCDEIEHKWFKLLDGLRSLIDLPIPRCVKPRDFDDDTCTELHHFAYASLQAYGACSYIRCINKFGQIHTQLLISNAPIKQRTIPRLELQAALLAAELDKLLITELDIEIVGSYFWSDSEVVLSYLRNETTRFHVFGENRVSAIWQRSNPDDWQDVNTKDNQADLLTRPKCLLAGNLDAKWFNGPAWLRTYKSEWPVYHANLTLGVNDPEVKVNAVTAVALVGDVTDPMGDPLYRVSAYFSNWLKMQRALAWFLRFSACYVRPVLGPLQLSEIKRAKIALIKQSQHQYYSKEIHQLTSGKTVNKSCALSALSPFLDNDGIMSVGGRTGEHPFIIPNEHPIVKAMMLHFHNEAHVGAEWTLSLMRQEFWIIKAKVLVKKLLNQCVTCKNCMLNQVRNKCPVCRQRESRLTRHHLSMSVWIVLVQ